MGEVFFLMSKGANRLDKRNSRGIVTIQLIELNSYNKTAYSAAIIVIFIPLPPVLIEQCEFQ